MEEQKYSTFYYAKLFLLMVIPIYGFFFTILLAFSKDMSLELRNLAKGALIARLTFWFVAVSGGIIFVSFMWPELSKFISEINILDLIY